MYYLGISIDFILFTFISVYVGVFVFIWWYFVLLWDIGIFHIIIIYQEITQDIAINNDYICFYLFLFRDISIYCGIYNYKNI